MPPNALDFADVVKTFRRREGPGSAEGRLTVLRSLDFSVPAGGIFGFLGLNGAGKTTAMKIALGLTHADSGRVSIFGQPPSVAGLRRIGFSPEKPEFPAFLSGEELFRLGCRLLGVDHSPERLKEVFSSLDLWEHRSRLVSEYSKGMQQRLSIACAMAHDPDLLILDEPMADLDPVGRKKFKGILKSLQGKGRTIFFSTHILSDITELCDRIGVLHEGRMVFLGTVSEFNPRGIDPEERLVRMIGGNGK